MFPNFLAADDDFAEVVAGEEEFDGGGGFEEFFDGAVVEVLDVLGSAAGDLEESFGVLDAVVIEGDFFDFLVGVEEGEDESAGAHDAQEFFNGLVDEGLGKKLKSVPDESAVEGLGRETESLFEETGGFGFGLLGFVEFVAERIDHGADDVIGRDAVTRAGDEHDVGLAGAGKIEDGRSVLTFEQSLELLKATAVAGRSRRMVRGRRFYECSFRNGEFHKDRKSSQQ